jgi:prolyl-tRNA synthetase
MTGGSLNGLKSGKALDKLKGALRDNPSEGLRTIVLDPGLEGRTNLVAGANKLEYHFRNVTPGRDFTPTAHRRCPQHQRGRTRPHRRPAPAPRQSRRDRPHLQARLQIFRVHGRRVLDANGKEVMPIMGSYGIGIERILTAAIESSAAKFKAQFPDVEKSGDQYALPTAIAPFEVVVTITNVREAELLAAGEKIAAELSAAGLDVLLDDRDERAGVKFKDAELIGIPYRINIGKKLSEGKVELVDRLTGTTTDLNLNEVESHLKSLVASSKP